MRAIIVLSIAMIVLAIAGSKFFESRVDTDIQANTVATSAQAARAQSSGNASRRKVEIESSEDGHFYLDAKIDGRAVAFMVDTGASVVVLRESDARRAGIRVARADFTTPMSTANGTSYAAPVMLRRVAVDGIELRDIRAVVVRDEQLGVNLLGATFLNALRRFGVSESKLTLEN